MLHDVYAKWATSNKTSKLKWLSTLRATIRDPESLATKFLSSWLQDLENKTTGEGELQTTCINNLQADIINRKAHQITEF